MDVYKISTSIDVTGNVTRELKAILGSFEKIENHAKSVKTHIDSWGGSIQRVLGEVRSLSRAMAGLSKHGGSNATHSFALGFNAKHVLDDVKKIQEALKGVRTGNGGASRSFSSWATSLSNSASAAERLERALAGVRSHAPGGSPVRVTGGGGSGGGHRRGGWHDGHYYNHEARSATTMVGSAGVPTSAIHGVEEMLKLAGGVDQVAAIQRLQGGMSGGRPMGRSQLEAEIARNKELAYATAFSQRYTTPLENMKTITDLADLGKGDYAEARALLPAIAKMNFATSLLGDEEVKARVNDKGQSRFLARGLDQMGVMAKSEAEQHAYFDAVTRGVVGTRGIFNGKQLFNAVQHSGGTATGWSPEFVGGVLPMFTEQMNGGASGDSIYMFAKHLLKGQMSNTTESDELVSLGLQKDSNRRGKKDFESGSIVGADVLKKDIYQWYKQYFKTALASKGITSDEGIDKAIDNLSFAKNYAKMFHEMHANEKNIDANLKRFNAQGSIDGLINETMGGQLQQLTQSTKTFLSVLADAKVGEAVTGLDALNTGISNLAKTLHSDPDSATKVFGGVAAAAAGATTLGVIALAAAAFAVGGPIAVLVAGIVAVATYVAATDWEGLVKKFNGLKEGIGLGGKGPAGVTSNPGDLLPGLSGIENEGKKAAEAQKGVAEGSKQISDKAPEAKSWLERLGDAMMDMARKAYASGAVIGQINFGGGGGGGSLIQKANFTPGGGGGLGSGIGGNGIVPPGITGSDANLLGLISKYESGGRNVMNYIGDRTHTAQGYYQITNSNWRKIAPRLGITAPNAMSASLADQARVAQVLLHNGKGIRNWSDYNPRLRGALQRGETYHGPAVPPPPPAPARGEQSVQLHVDGQRLASIMTRHQFKTGNRPATGANIADSSELYPVVG
jgi:hypothetical protein